MPASPRARRALLTFTLAAACAAAAPTAWAQATAWPTRPVRLVVGYAAGGATDQVARIVAQRLGDQLGQPVIIDNKAGANSNLAAEVVARAPADGYTLYVFTVANTINASLYPKLSYDPLKDLVPMGLMAKIPNIFVVNPALPVTSVAQFQSWAKTAKPSATFASAGSGSSIHLSGELFKDVARVEMVHVPYRGSAPAVTDLMAGLVHSMFDNAPSALPYVKSGKLRALAVTSAKRLPQLPDVPTMAEAGFPGFEVHSWFGLSAPAGTPRSVVDKVNAALARVIQHPDTIQRLQAMAAIPESSTPEQMERFAAAEVKRWREVVRTSGAQAD